MKKLTGLLLMILALSMVMKVVTATPITGLSNPLDNCFSIKMIEYNHHLFQEEYDKLKNGKSVNIDLLCQYNTDKESCKQCVLTEIEMQSEIRSQEIKQQIIFYSVEGILLLIIAGLFYFLIRTIKNKEIRFRILKIFLLTGGILLLLLFSFFILSSNFMRTV